MTSGVWYTNLDTGNIDLVLIVLAAVIALIVLVGVIEYAVGTSDE